MSQQPRKRNNPKSPAAKPRQAAAASELAVLHPNGLITLRKRAITVREYGWVEGLRIQSGCKDFLATLYALFARGGDGPPPAHAVREVFIEHALTVQWLISWSITPAADADSAPTFVEEQIKNAQWIATLNDVEGDALLAVWWGVNAGFFIRRFRELRMATPAASSPSETDASPSS